MLWPHLDDALLATLRAGADPAAWPAWLRELEAAKKTPAPTTPGPVQSDKR
jgi:hypothetical protein